MHGDRHTRATGPVSLLVCWLLAFAAFDPAHAADSAPKSESASLQRALAMLKEGADGREVATMLEPLAYNSNARAQLLLGSLYVEGKSMPRDVVEGYAWIQVASTALEPEVASLAKKTLLAGESAMSGGDLIRADQRAIAIRSAIVERSYERYEAGMRAFTSERPESFTPWIKFGAETVQLKEMTESQSNPEFRPGCAVVTARRCGARSQAVAEPRCTGRIARADAGPSSMPSAQTHLVEPEFPPKLRGRNFRGTATFVAHVDRSGWICATALAKSSGEPLWDAAAFDAVTLWRLKPAMLRGGPVESLFVFAVSANSPSDGGPM